MGLDFDELIYVLVFLVPLALRFLSGIVKAVARTFGIELSQAPEPKASGGRKASKSPRPLAEELLELDELDELEELDELDDDPLDPTPAQYLSERVGVREPEIPVHPPPDRSFRPLDLPALVETGHSLDRPPLGHLRGAMQEDAEAGLPRLGGGILVGASETLAGSGLHTQLKPRFRPSRRPRASFVPSTIDGWRRAIILQEVLAPPVALRREHRPGGLPPFEIV